MKTGVLEPVICIVDDDPAVRRALARLVESVGLRVEVFGTPEEFLNTGAARPVGCLLLDIHFPGMNGFELPLCGLRTQNMHIAMNQYIKAVDKIKIVFFQHV